MCYEYLNCPNARVFGNPDYIEIHQHQHWTTEARILESIAGGKSIFEEYSVIGIDPL
jgi:hypothetical protein